MIGIVKAYTTRVGGGPFPTELTDETGEKIARIGAEFGATTGRPRRCGWFDAVVARYAAMIGGISEWSLMKIDVLDELETIRVCTAYEVDGETSLSRCRPRCKRLKNVPPSMKSLKDGKRLPQLAPRGRICLKKLKPTLHILKRSRVYLLPFFLWDPRERVPLFGKSCNRSPLALKRFLVMSL